MTRLPLALLLLVPPLAPAADPLPDGAEMRLGGPPGFHVDHSAAISPDGKRIATIPPNSGIHVWEVDSGKLLAGSRYVATPSVFGWTRDGKLRGLFQGNDSFLLHEWADAKAAGPDEKTMDELRKDPNPLARKPGAWKRVLSPDGRRVAVLYGLDRQDCELRVYTPKPNTLCRFADPDFSVDLTGCEFIGFSGDGKTLFAIQRQPQRVTAYDLTAKKPGEPAWTLDIPWEPKREGVELKGSPAAVLSADGKRVVIEFSHSGGAEMWYGPTGKKSHSFEMPSYTLPGSGERALLALSPDGKRLAISSREKTGLVGGVVYDLDTGKEAVKLTAGPNLSHGALKYSPDGKRLYRSHQVWDAETGKDVSTRSGHRGAVRSLIVSGDGKTVVTSGNDLTARGWDAKTGKELWRADFPVAVTLRQVGPDAAVASERWWNTTLKKPLVTLSTGQLSALPGDMSKEKTQKFASSERTVTDELVALSPDGKTAVTIDRSLPSLGVWDWPKGTLRTTLKFDPPEKGRFDRVNGVAFTPDGKEFVGVFLYPDEKPRLGSGPAFRGVSCLERWDIAGEKRIDRTTFKWSRVPWLTTNGQRLLLVDAGTVTDAVSGEVVFAPTEEHRRSHRAASLHGAALSPDGDTLAGFDDNFKSGELFRFDLKTGKELGKWAYDHPSGLALAFLPDGRLVSAGEQVFVWKAVK